MLQGSGSVYLGQSSDLPGVLEIQALMIDLMLESFGIHRQLKQLQVFFNVHGRHGPETRKAPGVRHRQPSEC